MAGGRRIPVTVDADTSGDFGKAADGLDKVARKADDADDSLRKMSKGAKALDSEISKVEHSIKDLRTEFERTGDVDLLKDARKLEGNRKTLERFKADFESAGKESGKSFVTGLFTDASGTLAGLAPKLASSPAMLGIGGAIAVPIAAGLATALSGAALAGTAAAGLAGGIMLAAASDRVQTAWSSFADGAITELQDAATAFEEPLVEAAHTFSDALGQDMPAIRKDFQILAPLIDDLAEGAAGFVHNLQPGLQDAFKGAVPVIKELGSALPRLGDDASFFFHELGGAGTGGASALGLTVDALGGSLRVLGTELHTAALAYELFGGSMLSAVTGTQGFDAALAVMTNAPIWDALEKMRGGKGDADEFGTSVEDLTRHLDEAGQQEAFNEGMKVAAQAMQDGARAADEMEHQLAELARQILGSKDADLAFKSGRLDMVEALKSSKGALDDTTEAGIRAQQAILSQAEAAVRHREAVLAQTNDVAAADKVFDQHIQQIYADADANGVAKEKVDGLIGSLNTIPKPNPVDIELKRLGYSDDDLREMKRALLGSQGTYTATMNVVRNTYYNEITRSYRERIDGPFAGGLASGGFRGSAGIRKAAVGMFIPPSDPGTVLTGEPQTGGEWLIPARGISSTRAAMLGQRAMSGYGLDVVPKSGGRGGGGQYMELRAAPGDQVAEVLLSLLRPTVRGRYGGDPAAALGGAP